MHLTLTFLPSLSLQVTSIIFVLDPRTQPLSYLKGTVSNALHLHPARALVVVGVAIKIGCRGPIMGVVTRVAREGW